MRFSRALQVFACLLFSICPIFAQTAAPETEKSNAEIGKKALALLERTVDDADALRLPENRVYVLSSAAALLWERDEKRARALFRRAANELAAVVNQTEESGDELPENFWITQNARNQFLNAVAAHDAELALDFVRQTRPPVFSRMLNLPPDKLKLYRNLRQQAESDLNLEKEFAARLIKQNPRRAVELARANLSKGVSYADINLINALKNSEPELAAKFADEVLQKLFESDISDPNNYNARNLTQNFLSQFSALNNSESKTEFRLDRNALRRLATKYADYFSGSSFQQQSYYEIGNALPIFERLLPERVAALRQKYERLRQNDNANNQYNQFQERLNQLTKNTEAETLLAEAENFPVEMRAQIYVSAANKTAESGNYNAGRQILSALDGKQARQSALLQFDWQNLQKFLNEGKYAEARQIVAQQTESGNKIRFLMTIANHFSSKKQNEKAAEYIAEAAALANPNPENYVELSDLMQILSAGADGNAEKTFDLLESFAPKFNEIIAATAFLSKYQPGYGYFRDGELIFANSYFGKISFSERGLMSMPVIDINYLRLDRLAKADFERAMNLADRFDRADVRVAAKIAILRGILADNKTSEQQYPAM